MTVAGLDWDAASVRKRGVVITAQRIATTWRPRRSRLEKTTSEGTFLEPGPSFGAAHDAGQAGTCAQLTIAHILRPEDERIIEQIERALG